MTAAQTLIWEAAGRPPIQGKKAELLEDHPALCTITGEWCETTADAKKALGTNFSDHSLWACHSGRVGPAAFWCCSGQGKTSPRLWSWVCAPGENLPESQDNAFIHQPGLCLTNRANTRPIIDTLMDPPAGEWVLTIAESGQKHVLPYARTNLGAGEWTIRMEATSITATPETWRHVFLHVLALRRLGVPADAIKTGTPNFIKTMDQLDQWHHHNKQLAHYRTAPITDLALWCITKPILEDTNAYTDH